MAINREKPMSALLDRGSSSPRATTAAESIDAERLPRPSR